MTETGTTDGTIEGIDQSRGLEREGKTEVDPETGQRSSGGSEAIPEKEEGEDTKTESETGREIGGIGIGVGVEVGRSGDHGEVGGSSSISRIGGK